MFIVLAINEWLIKVTNDNPNMFARINDSADTIAASLINTLNTSFVLAPKDLSMPISFSLSATDPLMKLKSNSDEKTAKTNPAIPETVIKDLVLSTADLS